MAKKLKQEEFIQRAKEKFLNLDYSKTFYTGRSKPLTVICPIHGEQTWSTAGNFLVSSHGCPQCSKAYTLKQMHKKLRMSKDEFIQKALIKFGDIYDYSKVNYINNDTKVTIICPKHGEFEIRPGDFLRQTGCPKCKPKSLREEFIENWLKTNGIIYEKQKRIVLSNNKSAFIDFVINGVFVEYNGIQHYKDVKFFRNGGHNKIPFSFQSQKLRDNLVQKYCDEHKIKIIWLDYKQSDVEIEKLLQQIVNNF